MSKIINGEIDWEFEPSGDDNPFVDREEAGFEKVVQIVYCLEYTYTPGDPGCWRTANGDGWPASPPEIEWISKCIKLTFADGTERAPTLEEAEVASKWFDSFGSENSNVEDSIYEACVDAVENRDFEP